LWLRFAKSKFTFLATEWRSKNDLTPGTKVKIKAVQP